MKRDLRSLALLVFCAASGLGGSILSADEKNDVKQADPVSGEKAGPIFKDGEAQIVPAFKDPKEWIREDLFVETEFDSDGDGKKTACMWM